MSAFDNGKKIAQQGKPLPPQGTMPKATYEQLAAGYNAGKR